MRGFEFDWNDFRFKKPTFNLLRALRSLLVFVLVSLSLTIVSYMVFALCFSTRTEKALAETNGIYARQYAEMRKEDKLLGDAITALQAKDAKIYSEVFRSAAPNEDPVGKLDFLFASDTLPDTRLLSYTFEKSLELVSRAERVDSIFVEIAGLLSSPGFNLPPMQLPLENLSYIQIGAGEGRKTNPFYQTEVHHRGLDLIAPRGCPVLATSSALVTEASKSNKGQGSCVSLDHGNGYVTRYAHLAELKVRKGQRVRRGQVIGLVGMSGQAFAPHLHYEIIRDTVILNPINYIFASVEPEEYANMLFMAANTKQSMD